MEPYSISIITPVYKCAGCLRQLYARLINVLEGITPNFEIIFVNDCSPDESWNVILQLCATDGRVKGINLSRNFGQHYALTAGMDYCSGDFVIIMDCDLQDRPEEIPRLLYKCREGYDAVVAQRTHRQDTLLKRLSSKLFYKVFSYMTDTVQDPSIGNFGVYRNDVITAMTSMPENLRYLPTMVRWVGFSSATLQVVHDARGTGTSSYSWRKLFRLATDVVISFSDKPLRLTVRLGLGISFLSLMYALYIFVQALSGHTAIQGWSSLIVSIWFLSGLILSTLGVTGVYINKIFDQVKGRPLYIERDVVGFEGKVNNRLRGYRN